MRMLAPDYLRALTPSGRFWAPTTAHRLRVLEAHRLPGQGPPVYAFRVVTRCGETIEAAQLSAGENEGKPCRRRGCR